MFLPLLTDCYLICFENYKHGIKTGLGRMKESGPKTYHSLSSNTAVINLQISCPSRNCTNSACHAVLEYASQILHHCFEEYDVNFKGKDCIIHMPQHLAGMDKCMDKSCKRRAEYLHHSLVIVYTEHGQCQASFIGEKSACLMEVSVTEHILRKFPSTQKSWGN